MAIDYKLFSFACPPGVGGEWFLRAAELCGLGTAELKQAYSTFNNDQPNQLKVSLIRNPCTWIVECYDQLRSNDGDAQLLTVLNDAQPIDSFVCEYVRRTAGALGRIASRYEADTVLRIEDMPWAFVELVDSLGVPKAMRDRVIGLSKPKNLHSSRTYHGKMVANMERELMERYEYFA